MTQTDSDEISSQTDKLLAELESETLKEESSIPKKKITHDEIHEWTEKDNTDIPNYEETEENIHD